MIFKIPERPRAAGFVSAKASCGFVGIVTGGRIRVYEYLQDTMIQMLNPLPPFLRDRYLG